ncbi:MAG: lysylphosphatidylglycerol synthase domain-containing protein, partial [Candidatus Saccharimonadales bacterium]
IAFGHFVNPGAIILAYGIANFAGFVSILPGGIGVYETLMIAVLLAAGISPSLSVPVIIMYRVLNTVLQLPPGYYYYQKEISKHGKPSRNAEIL